MKFIILVCCVVLAAQRGVFADDVYVDGVEHREELLLNNVSIIWYSLAVDYNYNNLYYIDDERPAVLYLNSGQHKYIALVRALSLAVDQETHDVYIGTRDGIYKYKSSTDEVGFAGAAGDMVWHVFFFKGVLYYTKFGSARVYKLINGNSNEVDNMRNNVDKLVIDNEDVVFFCNGSGLYSERSNHTALHYNESYVYSLTVDRNGKVYFTTIDEINEVINATFRSVVSLKEYSAIASDKNNNIIYSTSNKIYRLKPTAVASDTNNCSNHQIDVEKQLGSKLDVMYQQIKKLVSDKLLGKLHDMDRKIVDLSQKIDKLTDREERKEKVEIIDTKTDKPLTGRAEEQLQFARSIRGMIHIDISN